MPPLHLTLLLFSGGDLHGTSYDIRQQQLKRVCHMTRPVGITIIAILIFLGITFCVLLEIRLFARSDLIADFISTFSDADPANDLPSLGAALLLILLVLPTLSVMAAWGLWKLKNWGRILLIALMINSSAFESIRWLLTPHVKMSFSVASVITLAINGLIIWYLLKPNVKAAFSSPNQSRTQP